MKLLVLYIFLIIISFSYCTVPLVIKSNVNDVEFYLKSSKNGYPLNPDKVKNSTGELYLGHGEEAHFDIKSNIEFGSDEGKLIIIGRKDGFDEAEVVIQPNYNEMRLPHVHIFSWTLGLPALAPLIYWLPAMTSYVYHPEKGQNEILVRLNFIEPKNQKSQK